LFVVTKSKVKDKEAGTENEVDLVKYRKVKVGSLHDGLREIHDGLAPGERVVVNGLQRVRDNAVVSVKKGKDEPKPMMAYRQGQNTRHVVLGPQVTAGQARPGTQGTPPGKGPVPNPKNSGK